MYVCFSIHIHTANVYALYNHRIGCLFLSSTNFVILKLKSSSCRIEVIEVLEVIELQVLMKATWLLAVAS